MVPDMMSQSEIDALLNAITSGAADMHEITSNKADRKVKVYDFKRPDKFSKDQLRAIQMIHDSFARQLTTSLSTLIRTMVSSEVVSVDQLAYEEFINSVVSPTVIGILEMYPFNGNSIIDMDPSLVFSIIDRMLGGKGEYSGKPRELTDIEKTVTERVMMRMLELLEESWSTVVDVRFRFESMESNPFFVQICPPRDMVLLVVIRLSVGEVEGLISLCIPYFLMEPIMDKLSSQQWFASTGRKDEIDAKSNITQNLNDVKLPMALELGHTILSLGDVYGLQEGDVLKLDEKIEDPIMVRVGNHVRFKAKPGIHDKKIAAEVLEVLNDEDLDNAN
ncbi:MAG: flagellar motor switch protein FliM [Synergistaceae bacterium]|nr:flagellar motor switch protein FliM [Synergistaceae bacterium]